MTVSPDKEVVNEILPAGWLTREQAQALTGYSEDHLTRLARADKVNARKLSGQIWLFERESLTAYQATARTGPKGKRQQA